MTMTMKRALLCAASAMALVVAGEAKAQEAAAAPVEASSEVEQVVVTAQKRSERNLEVPINITAYTGSQLGALGVRDFEALSAFTPGLIVQEQSPNNPGFVIRGLTSDSGESNIEPRVSVYQDGVSISRSRGSVVELFDVERIEVLKGPQSTLFGRSALIGAINVIQNKPDDELSATLTAGIGDEGQRLGEFVFNTPVIEDSLNMRIAGITRENDGFVENVLPSGIEGPDDLSGTDLWAVRGAMEFNAPGVTFDLIANFQQDTPTGTSFKSGVIPAYYGDTDPFSFASLNTFGGFEGGKELSIDREVWGVTLLGDIDINAEFSLSTITAYRRFESLEIFDADGSAFNLLEAAEDARGHEWSQEVRLNYEGEGIRGFIGVNYADEEGSQRAPLATDERLFALWNNGDPANGPVPALQGLATLAFASGDPSILAPYLGALGFKSYHVEEYINSNETKALDLFGDITVDITDDFSVTGGLRWSYEDKTTAYAGYPVNGSSALAMYLSGGLVQTLAVANTGGATFAQSGEFDGFTWRLIAEYEPADNLNLYASYARGRRPDIIEVADVNSVGTFAGFAVLPDETVDSFEVGAKSTLLDRRLNLEGSAFYYTYDNYQTTVTGPGGFPVYVNAGQATSYGLEGQVRTRLTDNLQAFATYAWNHGRFDEDSAFSENQFRLSPDHAFSIGFEAGYTLGDGTMLFVVPTYTWKSKVFFEEDNDPRFVQDGFGLLNLRAGLEMEGGAVTATLYGTNLLDEDYIIDAGNTGDTIGSPTFIRGNPRLLGVEFTGRF